MNERVSMMEVLAHCRPVPRSEITKCCPWCGGDASLPRKIMTRFLMGCESDECGVNPQAGGDTPEEAVRVWNRRAV